MENRSHHFLKLRRRLVSALISGLLSLPVAAQEPPQGLEPLRLVTLPLPSSPREHNHYFPELLELALSKTAETEGPVEITRYPRELTGARFFSMLERGQGIDVLWSMTNPTLERDLLRIPVSLLRGLNSHRVLLVRDSDLDRFAAVRNLQDLKQLRAGMVAHWPDTKILEDNGLQVVTSVHYDLLFNMLEAQRIDYFQRGLYEVSQEQQTHADKGIVIEPSLMLYYEGPIYFFVNRNNVALAERIERGLRMAIDDGSFDTLFFSVPVFKWGYDVMLNSDRRLLKLTPYNR